MSTTDSASIDTSIERTNANKCKR